MSSRARNFLLRQKVRLGAGVLAAALAALALSGAADPAGWSRPADGKALGLVAVQCDPQEFCFAVACPGGALQLINISPGGGPYGNPDAGDRGERAKLTVGKDTYQLTFTWDDAILEAMGSAGSRAALPVAALQGLAKQDGKIEGFTTGKKTATIRKAGLRKLWPDLVKACRVPQLAD